MIPLSVPNLAGNEWKYIKDCLDTNWVSSVGSYVGKFEDATAAFCGVKYAVATSNGTAALHMSLLLCGVGQGDLVIAPNVTFVAPVNAIRYTGATPILIDVNPATWQMDIDLLELFLNEETHMEKGSSVHKKTGKRIAALLPVHVLGNMCDMDRLMQLAIAYEIPVVEDATEALGSYYKGKHSGSFGTFGCLSFNGNKIITTGGGGMILTNDEQLAVRAKHLTTQAKSKPEEYFHDAIGYNYRLVNILAAMGLAQIEQLPGFLEKKKKIRAYYDESLKNIPGIGFQVIMPEVETNHWLYTVKLPRQMELRACLKKRGIEARPLWVPMNQLPTFKEDIYFHQQDHSDELYRSCLSIPCSTNIGDDDLERVVHEIRQFYHA
jgi:aminotransferase in exopolysaccharide biosynthesis